MDQWRRAEQVRAATGKVSVFRVPTPHSIPYGIVADRNDNIWMANWGGGKIEKFDTHNNSWTEFSAPTYPSQVRRFERRLSKQHLVGHLGGGQAPGQARQARSDDGPDDRVRGSAWNAMPYDVAPDTEGNIWFADSPTPDRSAAIGKSILKIRRSRSNPKPQFCRRHAQDTMTRDGAVWSPPRGARGPRAIRRPVVSRYGQITTLGAIIEGPPGYRQVAPTTTTRLPRLSSFVSWACRRQTAASVERERLIFRIELADGRASVRRRRVGEPDVALGVGRHVRTAIAFHCGTANSVIRPVV